MPGSGKFQALIESSARDEKRRKTMGYVPTALTIAAVVLLCWWATTTQGSRRFTGIEKFRGAIPDPPKVVRFA